jgi:tetratricopeptide (TPR) repeat protein
LAWVLWRSGETARARALAEKAVQLLETEPPGPELTIALNALAAFLMLAQRNDEAIRYAGRAIEVSEGLGLRAPIVRALATRGVSLAETGNMEGGVDDLQRALSIGKDLGLGFETAGAYGNLAAILEWNQGISVALELQQEGTAFCNRRGLGYLEMFMRCGEASGLFALGRWSEASAATEEVLEWDGGRVASQQSIIAVQDKARILLYQGQTEETAPLIEEMLPRAREVGLPRIVVPSIALAAEVELARGRQAAAVQLIHEIGSTTEMDPTWRVRVLAVSVRVLTRCGELEYADELIQGSSPRTPSDTANLLTARATLDEARGSLESSVAFYQDAVDAWTKHGHLVERAQALFGEGRCLVQLGRMQEAMQRLRAARDAFASFGAGPLTVEVDEWIARASALSS